MPNNRVLAAAFGVINVGTFLLYWTVGIYLPPNNLPEVTWSGFVVYLLVMIFTPALMVKARWTALGALIVGVIAFIRPILRLTMVPIFRQGPALILLLLALPFIYFSFRAYREK